MPYFTQTWDISSTNVRSDRNTTGIATVGLRLQMCAQASVLGRKNSATASAGTESAARFRRTYPSHCLRIAAVEIFPASSAIRWVAVIRSHLAPRLMPPGSRGTATSTVPLFFALRRPIPSPSLFYCLFILPGLTFCPPTFDLDANMFDS